MPIKPYNLNDFLTLSVIETLDKLAVTKKGLTSEQAAAAHLVFGYNELAGRKKFSAIKELLKKFRSTLVLLLIIIAAISLAIGDRRSAAIVFAMVFLSVILDFVQERKSNKAAEKLKEQVITKTEVWRDQKKTELPTRELAPGDIIELSVGDIVPADCRVIFCDDLYVNEASLTGESFPQAKTYEALLPSDKELSQLSNVVFMGTNVANGYGQAVVINIGRATAFGAIAKNLAAPVEATEFEIGVKKFGWLITKVILVLVVLIFILNSLVAGRPLFDSLLFSLALAVGLTPELLPMIMSITLARGSINMSRHGVIVKRLNSIHDFGGMDVLCTDKTGTLTENSIILIQHIDLAGHETQKLLDFVYLNSFYQSGLANPLDDAILKIKDQVNVSGYQKVDEVPFDFDRRRLSVVVEKRGERLMVCKGSPEEVFAVCSSYEEAGKIVPFDKNILDKAHAKYQELSADGFRVLALAYRNVKDIKKDYVVVDEKELILIGLVAFLDPPKLDSKAALDLLENQGIEVKIVTGDNDLVTKKICNEVGVSIKGIISGSELEKLTASELATAVEANTIFARVTPLQKELIIKALRANKHCVGYLGDGINDALPLAAADVGISVNNAVDVAKETADLILLTKDLKVLSLGVAEGRRTFGNTTKYILMGLSSNFGNMFSVAIASFVLPFLPMRPIQILLNNFMYDASQTTIPLDNVDAEYTERPKRWDNKLITKFMITFGPISSIFDLTTYAMMYFLFRANESLFQTGWFLESFATQTLVIFIIRTRKLPFLESRPGKFLAISVLFFVALAMYLPFSPVAHYFGFVAPDIGVMAGIWFLVIVYLFLVEMGKRWIYRRYFK